jgi:tricorn protease
VEGVGVSPDIEVDNDPAAVLAGRDPQLERAIEELEKETRQRKAALPPRPADPVKLK